ncbi:Sialin [Araneus ventricosus]|uniref:Sialin n=1 Tax=Araneus ventricosus TaxID=182803 RepID=A0A4Y2PIJ8_ARAVE|nr:Sialin [Araneus ventricosus]
MPRTQPAPILTCFLCIFQGMHYPSAYTLIARWAPQQERSTHLSACVIGTHFGVVTSMSITGYLCEHGFAGGWPSNAPVPWLQVALSAPVWAVTVAKFCGAWSFMCFQSKLPAYLDEALHMPIQKNGLMNALLFGALCISIIISGKLSDYIRKKNYFRITTMRKSFETVALLGPAMCMVAIPLVKCDASAVVILLTSAMALFGLCGGGDVSVIVDMAPDFAGKIFGVSNAIASIPGILAPVVAGYFLEGNKGDVQQWMYIFYISVGMYLFGAAFFLLFGSAEVQPWGRYSEEKSRKGSVKEANLIFTVPVILGVDNSDLKKNTSVIEMTKF